MKNTATEINTSLYTRVPSITICGTELKSCYNHNYFYNKNTGDLILEESGYNQEYYENIDDLLLLEETKFYYRIEENNTSINKKYLGRAIDKWGFGIFDMDYEGYPKRDERNIIVLDLICL